MTQKDLDVIQEKIGYKFKENYLLIQAFTRSSFAAENQNYQDNEKLEFIGDKVLDFIVVKKLTEAFSFSNESVAQSLISIKNGEKASKENISTFKVFEFLHSEGELTEIKKQIVQTSFLSNAIERLGLEKYLLMGKGDVKNNVQNEPHIKEDLFEALIGAIAIDSSWNMFVLEEIVEKLLNLDYHIKNGVDDGIDYISYVQNWHQKEFKTDPDYRFWENDDGNGYKCELFFAGIRCELFEGMGCSKKAAAKMAAKRAYEHIEKQLERKQGILEVIGDFSFDDAITKLQVLQDKKIISGLEYIFKEDEPNGESNGNPIWNCQCKINEINDFVEYGDAKKVNAKKAAAFTVLQILTIGCDKISEKLHNNFSENGGNNE